MISCKRDVTNRLDIDWISIFLFGNKLIDYLPVSVPLKNFSCNYTETSPLPEKGPLGQ
jgi:hypothetical protein